MSEEPPDPAHPSRVLRVSRSFAAAPARLFEAWTSPALASAWLFTSPTSENNTTEMDVWVGGAWTVTDRRDGVDYTAVGEYLEVERPRRLVFTFGMPQFSPLSTRVVVEIAPEGDGSVLALTQEGLPPDPGHHDAIRQGWSDMFDALDRLPG